MRYLIIWVVLFVIFCAAISALAKAVDGIEKLTKADRVIIAAMALSLSVLSTEALWIILN